MGESGDSGVSGAARMPVDTRAAVLFGACDGGVGTALPPTGSDMLGAAGRSEDSAGAAEGAAETADGRRAGESTSLVGAAGDSVSIVGTLALLYEGGGTGGSGEKGSGAPIGDNELAAAGGVGGR